ncbi:LacI family transcriptional regulator [Clavibacter michiganensis]|nr:LacI family DNA-binding transcriptional regulator [Clavibacter michiganensis]PPF62700.1 LacI family transcriptional regulator [Clavibacter michiganensis]
MSQEFTRGATLKDVAKKAGVSVSTASRLLDDRHASKTTETARRVRDAAAGLGYRRDYAASSLRRTGTSTIGVLVPRLSDAVMGIFYEEVARECERRDLSALVATTGDDPQRARLAAQSLISRKVDALVLTTARTDDRFAAELRSLGVPHVLALRTDGVSPSVTTDDELGGYLAIRHLADLGHHRIGIVAGPTYASSAAHRLAGAQRALVELGLDTDEALFAGNGFSVEAGEEAAGHLLELSQPPSALFAFTDHSAIGAMTAATRRGLRTPDDVSIVGYNDIPLARHLPTSLSSVRVSLDLIAQNAVRMLLDAGEESRVFAPTMIPRQSSARIQSA